MYRLVFLNGKDKGKRLAIRDAVITVGRDLDCSLRIDDEDVSRKHALIEQREDGVYLKDLDATNPTLVNDAPVKEARLRNGDRIEFGSTLLQFQTIGDMLSPEARRASRTEEIATAAVILIIVCELLFLVLLAARHQKVINLPAEFSAEPAPGTVSPAPQSEQAPPERSAPAAEAAAPESAPLAEKAADHATPAAEQQASSPGKESVVAGELQSLRTEVEELKKQVQDLAPTTSTTAQASTQPPSPTVPAAEAASTGVTGTAASALEEDVVLVRAQAMLRQATLEIARMNLVQADEILQRIQIMAPDFLPAYIERAKLYEQRGLLKAAGAQWTEVLNRSMGTPLYEQAAAERIRLARLEARQPAAVAPVTESRAAPGNDRLPRRIRIVDVQQERFPKNEQFEEMRLLRISLKPRSGERELDHYYIKVVVTFFDENTDTQHVQPTRAVVSKAVPVEGPWRDGQQKTVSATYIVPKGFREQEYAEHGEHMLYYGYVVQVYYREQLQDVEARPRSLVDELDRLPKPIHKP